ncbi:MAG: hypothetical protein ABIR94_12480 [Rubrivivax sp.]
MSDSTPSRTTPAQSDLGRGTAGGHRRGWLPGVLALLAITYLVVMVVTGALPRQRQLVEFEARGLMHEPPESVLRVEVTRAGVQTIFVREREGDWILDGAGPIAPEAARRVSMAVQFLNTSAPLRHLAQDELVGMTPAAFGLDRPVLAASLHNAQGRVIAVKFGADNPEGTAQYMSVDGRDGVYLISRFVGSEWAAVAAVASKR